MKSLRALLLFFVADAVIEGKADYFPGRGVGSLKVAVI